MGNVLQSDVVTTVKDVTGVYEDPGAVTFRLGLKDPGSSATPIAPTPNNYITVTGYHVTYIRADGRNTPGVDVPYPFDGAITVTVVDGTASAGFILVRVAGQAGGAAQGARQRRRRESRSPRSPRSPSTATTRPACR